ncbi:formate dehydrogenase subunit delta [Pseudonocardia alaniniphila]|uniref:Formate dehydrogenase subunit delta n=1 Tax=Pseudonocardia alaniniphila TaxID=75291 RepID=A0ABS9T8G2_9PSEU|nr:formate dehydrogenase subunit delta [Pseudonocardia alaniniphila]MCH6164824.1 formate dehydrogenase subunit delta [Pseudonocardia alaniniphila]
MSISTVPPHVRLANEVAEQFGHKPLEVAAAEVAAHLRDFWEPRMKRALREHVAEGGDGLDPVALRAAELLGRASS